jgi:hypothetical protein
VYQVGIAYYEITSRWYTVNKTLNTHRTFVSKKLPTISAAATARFALLQGQRESDKTERFFCNKLERRCNSWGSSSSDFYCGIPISIPGQSACEVTTGEVFLNVFLVSPVSSMSSASRSTPIASLRWISTVYYLASFGLSRHVLVKWPPVSFIY